MKPLLPWALLAATLSSAAAFAQAAPRRLPARAEAALAEPFSDIVGIRELRDGRVIVLDGKEQRLAVVDLATGRVGAIGRRGSGPGEYDRAVRLLAMPGDTTWVVDVGSQRLLVLGPDAAPATVITRLGTGEPGGITPVGVRAVDGAGRLYFVASGVRQTPDGFQPADSVAVLRFDRARGMAASVVTVAQARSQINVARDGKQVTSVEVVRIPFAIGDEWEVGADGRVVVARRDPYRLEVAGAGPSLVRGPAVPTETIPVTAADKAEYAANLSSSARTRVDALPWPAAKPPFLGRSIVIAGAEVWVRRTARAGAPMAPHDVFDSRGQRIATLVTPASHRIALVTGRGVYVVRTDDDGLQYVERYAVPR